MCIIPPPACLSMFFSAERCNHYCPATGKINENTEDTENQNRNPSHSTSQLGASTLVISSSSDICFQLDVKILGSTLALNLGVQGTVTIESESGKPADAQDNPHSHHRSHSLLPSLIAKGGLPTLTAQITVMGGVSFDLQLVAGSVYIEGSVSATVKLPEVLCVCSRLVDFDILIHVMR